MRSCYLAPARNGTAGWSHWVYDEARVIAGETMFIDVGVARDDEVRRDGRWLRATSPVTARLSAGAAGELDRKIRGGLLEAGRLCNRSASRLTSYEPADRHALRRAAS
jgi:hypothetical protein